MTCDLARQENDIYWCGSKQYRHQIDCLYGKISGGWSNITDSQWEEYFILIDQILGDGDGDV